MERMPLTVVLDNVRSAQNVGAFFRTGDAFAVERICLCGITPAPPAREIHKTALGAELTVAWCRERSAAECVRRLSGEGCCVLAVEQVEGPSGSTHSAPNPGGVMRSSSATRSRVWRRRSWTSATAPWRSRRPVRNTRSTFRSRPESFCGISFAESDRNANFAAFETSKTKRLCLLKARCGPLRPTA